MGYSKPTLNGHKVHYQGRRFWVFEVSSEFPFHGSEKIDKIVVFDGVYNADICWCHINEKGEYEGVVPYGQHGLGVSGKTVREFIADVAKTIKWCERH
jgi:hypothetical protein